VVCHHRSFGYSPAARAFFSLSLFAGACIATLFKSRWKYHQLFLAYVFSFTPLFSARGVASAHLLIVMGSFYVMEADISISGAAVCGLRRKISRL